MDHIKGKWRIATEKTDMLYIEEDHGRAWNNPTICLLYQDVTPTDSVGCIDLEALPNAAANAHLIAAAPDLLAALEAAFNQMFNYDDAIASCAEDEPEYYAEWVKVTDAARAAIARARGVSQ